MKYKRRMRKARKARHTRLSLKDRYLIYESEKKNPDLTMNYEDWAKDRINTLNI